MNVTLICGGPSSEHEVSINSSKSIFEAIDTEKYTISLFYIDRELKAAYIASPKSFNIPAVKDDFEPLHIAIEKHLKNTDLCLLAGIHGEFVEDGQIQGLLDYYGIKYTGTGRAASALAMDKFRTALVVNALEDIVLPATLMIDLLHDNIPENLTYPLIMKPNTLGSSVHVAIIRNEKDLRGEIKSCRKEGKFRYALLQEYLEGSVEITCGCLEDTSGKITLLPPIEIVPHKAALYDYASKYQDQGSTHNIPPTSISKSTSDRISELAAEIHQILGCKTYSRSDFLIKDDTIFYLETNTLPGMTKTSLIPDQARAIGMSFPDLIDFIIDNA